MHRRSALGAMVTMLATCVSGVTPDTAQGDLPMIEQQTAEMMRRLDSLDLLSRMKLLSEVDEQRVELLGVLLRHLGTTRSPDVQAAAIYLIGRHRLSDGARELVRWIDFAPPPPDRRGPEPLWEKYPAMEALIAIGRPSVAPVIELLASDGDPLKQDLAVKVLRYAEDAGVASFILERAIRSESDSLRQTRLRDALARLSTLPQ
jgi:hypothetical protein